MDGHLGNPELLKPKESTRRIGRQVHLVAECASTNDLALNGGAEASDGDLYFTEYQTAGRGRLGRTWRGPRGASVLCSVRLVEAYDPARWVRLSLAAGIAVQEAIRQSASVSAWLKWPNDVMIGDRKVAGVLIETRPLADATHLVAVGVGINCLQHRGHFEPEPGDSATSLEIESEAAIDRRDVARHLIASLDCWLDRRRLEDPELLKEEWCRRSRTIGSRVRLRSGDREYAGHVLDLDPDGGILVALDEGGQRLFCPLTTSTLA